MSNLAEDSRFRVDGPRFDPAAAQAPWRIDPAWTRYVAMALVLPWATPFIIHAANHGNQTAELLSILVWPFLFLFVGMYLAGWRVPALPRDCDEDDAQWIRERFARYGYYFNMGVFLLALYEFSSAIALAVGNTPWTACKVHAMLTVILFLPSAVFMVLAEDHLGRAKSVLDGRATPLRFSQRVVDRPARDRLARLVRAVGSGRCLLDEYQRETAGWVDESRDAGVHAAHDFCLMAVCALADLSKKGQKKLRKAQRGTVARIVVFLHSDYVYEWPSKDAITRGTQGIVAAACTIMLLTGWTFGVVPGNVVLPGLGLAAVAGLVIAIRANRAAARERNRWAAAGDDDCWPFLRHEQLVEASARPRFLAGRRQE